jgi:hypothetical protein
MNVSHRMFLSALILVTAPNLVSATIIDFESPTYAIGQLEGQDGWGHFTGSATENAVISTVNSGLYVGGQAAGFSSTGQNSKLFDLYGAPDGNGFQFDVRSGTGINCVFATTLATDSPTVPDFAPLVGIKDNSFYVRTINTTNYTVAQGSTGQYPGFTSTTSGNWYRMTVAYDAAANSLSVTAINLSSGGSAVTTGYETIANLLNSTTHPDASSRQAFFDSMIYTDLRISNSAAAVDNISNIVPEPMTFTLLSTTVIALLGIRHQARSRKQ